MASKKFKINNTGKVFLRSLANVPELVTDRLTPGNWETNVLCKIDGTGRKFFVSVGERRMGPERLDFRVLCRNADPFASTVEGGAFNGYGRIGFPDLEAALAYANGEEESPLAQETRPATREEVSAILCLGPSTESQPEEIDRPCLETRPPAEALGLPPPGELRGVPAPVKEAYERFIVSLTGLGIRQEAIVCDSSPFYVTRWYKDRNAKDENLWLLEILFGGDPGILAGFRKQIIEDHEEIETVPEDPGEEWCVEFGQGAWGAEPLRLFLQWERIARESAELISSLALTKIGPELFRFKIEPMSFMPCAPDIYRYAGWRFGEDWIAVARIGVHDDDYVAYIVPQLLGFVRIDRFLKGLCRLFTDNAFAWSGATPFLGKMNGLEGPWGRVNKAELALAVACGYADMFKEGPWHRREMCKWSEARLRRVARDLSRAGVDPLELVHVVYMGRESCDKVV